MKKLTHFLLAGFRFKNVSLLPPLELSTRSAELGSYPRLKTSKFDFEDSVLDLRTLLKFQKMEKKEIEVMDCQQQAPCA